MSEDLPDDGGTVDGGDQAQAAPTVWTRQHVNELVRLPARRRNPPRPHAGRGGLAYPCGWARRSRGTSRQISKTHCPYRPALFTAATHFFAAAFLARQTIKSGSWSAGVSLYVYVALQRDEVARLQPYEAARRQIEAAARALKLEVKDFAVNHAKDLAPTFTARFPTGPA